MFLATVRLVDERAAGSVLPFRFRSRFPPIPLGVAGWQLRRAGVGTRRTG